MRSWMAVAGVVSICVLMSIVSGMGGWGEAHAQTVPTCTPAAPCKITWNPNTEPDMKEYRVLLSKTSGQYDVTKPAAVIAHPTASGSTTSIGSLLGDGVHFITVVAVDQSGNVSALSNEESFKFDGPPGAPVITITATIP